MFETSIPIKNGMKRLIILIPFILTIIVVTSHYSPGQILIVKEGNRLEVSYNDLIFAKVNGMVQIRDIIVPDDNFDCLKLLGEPIEVDHQVIEHVGEIVNYNYRGLKLYYAALSQPEFLLNGIKFHEESEIIFDSLNRIKVGSTIESGLQLDEMDKNGLFGQNNVVIYTSGYGPWIRITQESGIIKEIMFYSSRD